MTAREQLIELVQGQGIHKTTVGEVLDALLSDAGRPLLMKLLAAVDPESWSTDAQLVEYLKERGVFVPDNEMDWANRSAAHAPFWLRLPGGES